MTRIIDKSNIKHKTLEEVNKEIRNSKSEVILEERKCEYCGGILVKSYGCGIGLTYCVDCGENINLFLSIASLRDDTAKYQWFTDDNIMEMNTEDLPSKYMMKEGHKCTVEELTKIFNK